MNSKILWDIKAWLYARFRRVFPFGKILDDENRALKSLLAQIPLTRGVVIDLGTGTGNALDIVPADFVRIGLDSNFEMLKFAKQQISGYYIQSDILNAALKSDSADILIMCGVWEYIKNRAFLVSEILRIIKRNGYAVMTYSPPKPLTSLRILLGLKIYPIAEERMYEYLNVNGLKIMALRRCMLQHQILIKKTESNGTSQI
ncbi:methyltransferase domain-containing protein [candidate division KSB1 bacterium]|nr:methyltransferase domain-containing protein [candidate division KSB1 bacterium]